MDSERNAQFDYAVKNRDREIALLWTRSNAMWVVVAICFAAYGVVRNDPLSSVFVAVVGFVASSCWAFMIVGSKWWQECWEVKMQLSAPDALRTFVGTTEEVAGELWLFKLKRYSVAKVMIVIASFLTVMWASAVLYDLLRFYAPGEPRISMLLSYVRDFAAIYLVLVGAAFVTILSTATVGRDKVGVLKK
jgi:hypothetical protein